ncbi:MAG: hypothetical protein AAF539_13575 [Planctomycetota bacterium]
MSIESQFKMAAFQTAVEQRDAAVVCDQLSAAQFVLIHIQESGDSDSIDGPDADDELGALTADVDDQPCLVAFASQDHATRFVDQQRDLFASDDEVGGFVVSGQVMLDYLSEEYGLLINPESDDACFVDRDLIGDVLDELGLE